MMSHDFDISRLPLADVEDGNLIYVKKHTDSEFEEDEFTVGQEIEVLDESNEWVRAKVYQVYRPPRSNPHIRSPQHILVHYEGWSDAWNEWLQSASKRISLRNTHLFSSVITLTEAVNTRYNSLPSYITLRLNQNNFAPIQLIELCHNMVNKIEQDEVSSRISMELNITGMFFGNLEGDDLNAIDIIDDTTKLILDSFIQVMSTQVVSTISLSYTYISRASMNLFCQALVCNTRLDAIYILKNCTFDCLSLSLLINTISNHISIRKLNLNPQMDIQHTRQSFQIVVDSIASLCSTNSTLKTLSFVYPELTIDDFIRFQTCIENNNTSQICNIAICLCPFEEYQNDCKDTYKSDNIDLCSQFSCLNCDDQHIKAELIRLIQFLENMNVPRWHSLTIYLRGFDKFNIIQNNQNIMIEQKENNKTRTRRPSYLVDMMKYISNNLEHLIGIRLYTGGYVFQPNEIRIISNEIINNSSINLLSFYLSGLNGNEKKSIRRLLRENKKRKTKAFCKMLTQILPLNHDLCMHILSYK